MSHQRLVHTNPDFRAAPDYIRRVEESTQYVALGNGDHNEVGGSDHVVA